MLFPKKELKIIFGIGFKKKVASQKILKYPTVNSYKNHRGYQKIYIKTNRAEKNGENPAFDNLVSLSSY